MNGVDFRYGKYMNGSCFSLGLVYEWGGVRGLQPHIRTQNHGKLPPRGQTCRHTVYFGLPLLPCVYYTFR